MLAPNFVLYSQVRNKMSASDEHREFDIFSTILLTAENEEEARILISKAKQKVDYGPVQDQDDEDQHVEVESGSVSHENVSLDNEGVVSDEDDGNAAAVVERELHLPLYSLQPFTHSTNALFTFGCALPPWLPAPSLHTRYSHTWAALDLDGLFPLPRTTGCLDEFLLATRH